MLGLITKHSDSQRIAERIAERVAVAQAAIDAADQRVPALRAEDAALEREVAQLLGEQIAEGDTRHGQAIAQARSRRREIAGEIEGLVAQASAAKQGIEEARRIQVRAKVREARERARDARKALAERLDRAGDLFRELYALDSDVATLAGEEWDNWREESRLRAALDPRDADAPPHSDVPMRGSHLFDAVYATLLDRNVGIRPESVANAIARVTKIAEKARAADR